MVVVVVVVVDVVLWPSCVFVGCGWTRRARQANLNRKPTIPSPLSMHAIVAHRSMSRWHHYPPPMNPILLV